nr:hypothetical protein [uncultured Methanoregula sp.]
MKEMLQEKRSRDNDESIQEKPVFVFSKSWFDHGMEIWVLSIIGLFFFGWSYTSKFLAISLVFYIAFVLGIIAISLMIFLVIIIHKSYPFLNTSKIIQYPDNLETSGLDYDAIIIAHSQWIRDIGMGTGVHNIVNKLSQEKYPYKIIHCDSPGCVAYELRKDHAKYVWLFGHGWRGGLGLKTGDLIYEEFVREKPALFKKKFIGQFHCNSLSKKRPNVSLIETLIDKPNPNQYFITEGNMNHYSVWDATRKVAIDIHRDANMHSKND